MSEQDDALQRLRAADPAASASTDSDALRRAVDARTDDGSGADDAATSSGAPDELAGRREARRRRTRWLAGAAAAAVVVGLGGYALGAERAVDPTTSSAGEVGTGQAQGPVVLGPGPQGEGGVTGLSTADATGSEGTSLGADRIGIAWGRAVFTSSGLPTDASSAEAFAYDPTGLVSAETVAGLAAALGIDGEPVDDAGSWRVGDWSGPTVQVIADGTASLSYSDPTADPWACAVSPAEEPDAEDSSGASGGSSDGFAGCEVPEGAGAPEDAVAQAEAVLTDLGVDTPALDLRVDTTDDRSVTVGAYPTADGPQGIATWSVGVASDGVYSVYGSLAPLVSLGAYDVVPATQAVERLMDPRFGQGGGGGPVPLAAEDAAEGAEQGVARDAEAPADDAPVDNQEPVSPPVVPSPGDPVPWPVQSYEITGAELVQGTYYTPDGASLVLPAWLLTTDEGYQWSVIAVADGSLDLTATP